MLGEFLNPPSMLVNLYMSEFANQSFFYIDLILLLLFTSIRSKYPMMKDTYRPVHDVKRQLARLPNGGNHCLLKPIFGFLLFYYCSDKSYLITHRHVLCKHITNRLHNCATIYVSPIYVDPYKLYVPTRALAKKSVAVTKKVFMSSHNFQQ